MNNSASLIRKHMLLNIPYIMIFWFAGKIGEAYRLTVGADTSAKIINIQAGIAAAFDNLLPSFHPQDLLIGLIGAAAVYFAVWNKKKNAKKFRKDIEYGSARWSA